MGATRRSEGDVAGRVRTVAVQVELEEMAKRYEVDTPLEAACEWLEHKGDMRSLVKELQARTGLEFHASTVERALAGVTPGGAEAVRAALSRARARSAFGLADEAKEIIDKVVEDRDAIAKAKAQADLRLVLAGKYNKDVFGEQKQQGVQLTINVLHLDSLRRVNARTSPLSALAEESEVAQLVAGQGVDLSELL